MFFISGGHIGGQFLSTNGISIQSSIKVREAVVHKDLRFGQIVYILVFYNISFSWLLPLDGFQFIFLCRVYCVTVKTKKSTDKDRTLFLYNHFCFP